MLPTHPGQDVLRSSVFAQGDFKDIGGSCRRSALRGGGSGRALEPSHGERSWALCFFFTPLPAWGLLLTHPGLPGDEGPGGVSAASRKLRPLRLSMDWLLVIRNWFLHCNCIFSGSSCWWAGCRNPRGCPRDRAIGAPLTSSFAAVQRAQIPAAFSQLRPWT